jgi:hypothetical protein
MAKELFDVVQSGVVKININETHPLRMCPRRIATSKRARPPVRRCSRSSGSPIWRSTSMRGRAAQVFKVIFISETARSATVLHQTLIEPDEVKWRLAGQDAATVLNRAAQADIVRAFPLCRVVR